MGLSPRVTLFRSHVMASVGSVIVVAGAVKIPVESLVTSTSRLVFAVFQSSCADSTA